MYYVFSNIGIGINEIPLESSKQITLALNIASKIPINASQGYFTEISTAVDGSTIGIKFSKKPDLVLVSQYEFQYKLDFHLDFSFHKHDDYTRKFIRTGLGLGVYYQDYIFQLNGGIKDITIFEDFKFDIVEKYNTKYTYGIFIGMKKIGEFCASLGDKDFLFKYKLINSCEDGDHLIEIKSSSKNFLVGIKPLFRSSLIQVTLENEEYYVQYKKVTGGYRVKYSGYDGFVSVNSLDEYNLKKGIPEKVSIDTEQTLISPMPGRVVKILVKKGQKIKIGEDLIILDAMKMENIIKAEKDSEVSEIFIKENDAVFVDQELMSFI